MKDRSTLNAVVGVSDTELKVNGIQPGMVWTVALVCFGPGEINPMSRQFKELVGIIREMRRKGGQEPVRKLKTYLREYNYDALFEPIQSQVGYTVDGREYYHMLLDFTLRQLQKNGPIRMKPFVLSTAMLDGTMKRQLRNLPNRQQLIVHE